MRGLKSSVATINKALKKGRTLQRLGLSFGIIEDNKGGEFFIKMSGTDFYKGKSSSMKPTYNIDNPNLPYQIKLDL